MATSEATVSYHLTVRVDRPVEGCELNPSVYLQQKGGASGEGAGNNRGKFLDNSMYYFTFSWERGPAKCVFLTSIVYPELLRNYHVCSRVQGRLWQPRVLARCSIRPAGLGAERRARPRAGVRGVRGGGQRRARGGLLLQEVSVCCLLA